MSRQPPSLQWACNVLVFHSPDFGHKVVIMRQRVGGVPEQVDSFSWKGLGIPTDTLQGICAMAHAVIGEHLVWRYGVADELDLRWAGDPEPF